VRLSLLGSIRFADDWPPGMCHTHHTTPWSQGGTTTVADAILLCPRHHTLAHDSRYQLKTDKQARSPSLDAPDPEGTSARP